MKISLFVQNIMVDYAYVRHQREYELHQIIPYIPKGSNILEIGSGAGWQSRKLAEIGFSMKAIELQDSKFDFKRAMVWPVKLYNGENIPYDDNDFDVVFSSHVLEHIPHIVRFQDEIKRVLKPGGLAIHIVPSSSCAFWDIIFYYVFRFKILLYLILYHGNNNTLSGKYEKGCPALIDGEPSLKRFKNILRKISPKRHGERGNIITEINLFSNKGWRSLFEKTEWGVIKTFDNNLFYTGQQMVGSRLNIHLRRRLSKVMGSSAIIWILKKR